MNSATGTTQLAIDPLTTISVKTLYSGPSTRRMASPQPLESDQNDRPRCSALTQSRPARHALNTPMKSVSGRGDPHESLLTPPPCHPCVLLSINRLRQRRIGSKIRRTLILQRPEPEILPLIAGVTLSAVVLRPSVC